MLHPRSVGEVTLCSSGRRREDLPHFLQHAHDGDPGDEEYVLSECPHKVWVKYMFVFKDADSFI